ncbi:MAG: GWxTD domain-containing protein [Candidatus Latescibacteria bacterium]|nr:GWxTD domain-containing protein [Candidatus Latescibacterota bacterium]
MRALVLQATVTVMLLCAASAGAGEAQAARSPDGKAMVYAVTLGAPRALITEVWVAEADGGPPNRVGVFLGGAGDLLFLQDGDESVFLQKSLACRAPGLSISRRRDLPLMRNRIWRIRADGSRVEPWPLPKDMHPLAVSKVDRDDRILVKGRTGDPVEGGLSAIWEVDRKGNVTGRRTPVGFARRHAAGEGDSAPMVGGNRPLGKGERADSEQALRLAGRALDLFARGYAALHQDDWSTSRGAFKEAGRTFERIRKAHRRFGLVKADPLGYAEAVRTYAGMDTEASRRLTARDHLQAVGDLVEHFSASHESKRPQDLNALRAWAVGKIRADARDPQALADQLGMLDRVLPSLEGRDETWELSTIYDAEAREGEPVFSRYLHGGLAIHAVVGDGGIGVITRDVGPVQIDSLRHAASELQEAGDLDRSVRLLEAIVCQQPESPAALTDLGHGYIEAGDYDRAERVLKTATTLGRQKEVAGAYYGLGLVYARDSRGFTKRLAYSKAVEFFRDALIRDQDHMEARFERAKVRYALGDRNSMIDVKRTMERNPDYAPAYKLMGDWHAYFKSEYKTAAEWYRKYAEMEPDDVDGLRELGYSYLRLEQYEEILSSFHELVQLNPKAFGLLPIVAQACVKTGEPEQAQKHYETYLARVDSTERGIYDDVRVIASTDEAKEYERTTGEERASFLKRFWNKRDSDITTPVNERLLEHYRRVWYARCEYSKRVQPWDARGEVYVRFGDPAHKTSSQDMNLAMDPVVVKLKERMALDLYGVAGATETYTGPVFPIRSRVIEETTGDVTGGGSGEGLRSETQLSGTPSLENMGFFDMYGGGPGDTAPSDPTAEPAEGEPDQDFTALFEFNQYHPVTMAGGDNSIVPWECWIYTRIAGGFEVTFTDEGLNGTFRFAPMPVLSASINRAISVRQMAQYSRYLPEMVFDRAVAGTPDYYLPVFDVEPLDFWFDQADFRGSDGRSALEVYYGIPNDLAEYREEADLTRMMVDRRVALMSATSDTIYRSSGELFYQRAGDTRERKAFVPDVVRLEVPPGEYRMEVRAADRRGGRLGIYRKQVQVEAYGRDSLQMSDLELAWRIESKETEGVFTKGGLEVIPMPTRVYREGEGIFVFYEIYNLTRDAFGQTNYRVEYTVRRRIQGGLGKIATRFARTVSRGKREEVAVGYEQMGVQTSETAYVELDLTESDRGQYELQVAVTDLNSERAVERRATFGIE